MTTMPPTSNTVHAYRGRVLHFLHDPQYRERDAYEYWEDGLLVVLGGKVIKAGDYAALREDLPAGAQLHDYSGKLIVPGFIDTHIHFPQTDMIASPSPGLLHWLETYTFPEERRFESEQYAAGVASFFLDELLRNGTTSAMVWSTVHRGSAETLFTQAQQRGMRMITGKVMMDRNCPEYLRDTAESGARDTADLISRWHGKDRLAYAITPRFAPASREAQLQACADLAKQCRDVVLQTHVAENPDEVKWVADLFPDARSYLDVYDRYGLLRKGAFTAAPSGWATVTAYAWPNPAQPWRTAPPPTCSWAAASTTSTRTTHTAWRSRWRPTWAAAARSRCCARWARRTRSRAWAGIT